MGPYLGSFTRGSKTKPKIKNRQSSSDVVLYDLSIRIFGEECKYYTPLNVSAERILATNEYLLLPLVI